MDMINELATVATAEYQWQESAQGVISEGWLIENEVDRAANNITNLVLSRIISVDELRGGVVWANALDAEAVQKYGSDICSGDERLERTARRIMHLAGRNALENVKSRRRRSTAHILKNATA